MLCTITSALSSQLSCTAAIFIRVYFLQFNTSQTLKSSEKKLSKIKQLYKFICSLDEVSFFVYLPNLGSKLSIKSIKVQQQIIVTFLFFLFCRFCFVHSKRNRWISQKLYHLLWWNRLFSISFGGNDEFPPNFPQQLLSHGGILVVFWWNPSKTYKVYDTRSPRNINLWTLLVT